MRYYEFAKHPISALVQTTIAPAPQPQKALSFSKKLKAVQQRKIRALLLRDAYSKLQQQGKVTERDVVFAMQAAADLRRSGL